MNSSVYVMTSFLEVSKIERVALPRCHQHIPFWKLCNLFHLTVLTLRLAILRCATHLLNLRATFHCVFCRIFLEKATKDELLASRQAYAGLLWSKQFYHYVVKDWLEGDPDQPKPPSSRNRNLDWKHLFNRDIISMPDKWEYPWVCIDVVVDA